MTSSETNANPGQSQQRTRREMLEQFVARNPADAFARYGLAMECVKADDTAAAENHFKQLLAQHPEYVAGYFHYGQMLAKLGRTTEARQTLSAGIAEAARRGDEHARGEMQAALDVLNLS